MVQSSKMNYFPGMPWNLESKRKFYSHLYRSQSNGCIEGFHKFIKNCLPKHITRQREWDDVIPIATASYSWLANQHSKESPYFVIFGRDAMINLSHLTRPNFSYMGTEYLILDFKIMSSICVDLNTQPQDDKRTGY